MNTTTQISHITNTKDQQPKGRGIHRDMSLPISIIRTRARTEARIIMIMMIIIMLTDLKFKGCRITRTLGAVDRGIW